MNLAGYTQQGAGYNQVYLNLSPTLNFSGSFSNLVSNSVQSNSLTYVDLSTNTVHNVNQDINSINTYLTNLSSVDQTLSSNVFISLSSNIISLSSRIYTLSSNVSTLSSNIVTLSSNIVTLSSNIVTLSTSLFKSGSVVRSIINSPVSGLPYSGTFGPLFFSTNTTTFTTCFTTTYTPLMTLSCVLVAEFDCSYTISNYGGDEWQSQVLWSWGGGANNQVSGSRRQVFNNSAGGGTRSGCIFPIQGVFNYYTGGSVPIPMTISIQVKKVSGDDTLSLDGSYFFRITEIVT